MSIFNNAIYLDDVPKEQWKNYGIGRGYRSIIYTTDHDKNGKIILLGFDIDGNPATYIFPWKSYVKYKVKYKTDERDIYDNYVATKYFNNKQYRDAYVKEMDGNLVVECLKPEQEFAHFMWDFDVLDTSFNKQTLRVHSLDIETEISEQFEKPADARNRINMITIHDSLTDKFYTWSLEHAEIDFKEEPLCNMPKDRFVFFEFYNNEERMLEHFLSWYEDNYPDVNYGWNTKAYDIPYLVRRIENVLGKNDAKRLSPVGRYFIKEVNHDNERADVSAEIEVDIAGLFIADGLVLYRDKFGIGRPDGGFSLDNIGEYEGLGHKIKYDGTLKDLYLKDYQKFYEYNVRDVDLCKRINDKNQMIALARQITSFGLTGYGAIYSSISYLIGSVIAFARTEFNGKIFQSYLPTKHNFDGFEGAFVFPTVQGIYKNGVGTIDFASLYPSNIRSINASPETYVGKVIIRRKDEHGLQLPLNLDKEPMFDVFDDKVTSDPFIIGYALKLPNGKLKDIKLEQIRELIKQKCIYTANNTLFLKHEIKWGVIAKWCEYFYNLRKQTKKKELKCFHTLHGKDADKLTKAEIRQLETDEQNYHTVQLGIKAMINSIYGCMGTKFSPIANPDMAQSVTRQGRFCNQATAKFIHKRFMELYGAPEDYVLAISGDTDSSISRTKIRIKR